MSKISSTIEAKFRATFNPQEAEMALVALAEMKEPPTSGEWAMIRMRVQAAVIITAEGKFEALLSGIANSQIDWRDALMAGGLGDSNWHSVAKEAGFDIT